MKKGFKQFRNAGLPYHAELALIAGDVATGQGAITISADGDADERDERDNSDTYHAPTSWRASSSHRSSARLDELDEAMDDRVGSDFDDGRSDHSLAKDQQDQFSDGEESDAQVRIQAGLSFYDPHTTDSWFLSVARRGSQPFPNRESETIGPSIQAFDPAGGSSTQAQEGDDGSRFNGHCRSP